MAALEWKCMVCNWVGTPLEIKTDENDDHFCPACGDFDVFPQRYFRCLICGYEAEQYDFFPELCADEDPEEDMDWDFVNDPVNHERPSDGDECESYIWIQIK